MLTGKKVVTLTILSMSFLLSLPGMDLIHESNIQEKIDKELIEAKKLIKEGFDQWDDQMMLRAHTLCEELLTKDDEKQWLTLYYLGYIDFRLIIYYRVQDKIDLLNTYLDEGIDHLESSIKINSAFAESHALLALLIGTKFRRDPGQISYLGQRTRSAISEAKTLDGDNPRVIMIAGIINFYTPVDFGGSTSKALEDINRSITLFETSKPVDEILPDWGHGDALTWQGRIYMEKKEFDRAEQSLEKALSINSHNRFAQMMKQRLQQISGN